MILSPLLKEEIFLIGIFIAILIMAEPKPAWLMIGLCFLKQFSTTPGLISEVRAMPESRVVWSPSIYSAAAAINAMGSYLSCCQLNHCYLKTLSDLSCVTCSILLKVCMQFFCTIWLENAIWASKYYSLWGNWWSMLLLVFNISKQTTELWK